MTEIKSFLDFLKEEKVMNLKVYKNFQNLDCIIGTVSSLRHINALMNKVKKNSGLTKNSITGYNTSWGILFFEDFDCHLFIKDQREYYDLDSLWGKHGRI